MYVHYLHIADMCCIWLSMDMARHRKPVTVSLDPELVEWLRTWCKKQNPEVAFARALDSAILLFKEERGNE